MSIEIAPDTAAPGTTASSGVDFNFPTTAVTIPAGQSTATLSFPILDDQLDEDDEIVTLHLQNPTPGLIINETGSTRVHTIVDDDALPVASFSAPMSAGTEGADFKVTVTLNAQSGREVRVPFSTSGSAGPGEFTVTTPSPLVFPAGTTSLDISVTANNDNVDETDDAKTLVLTLGQPTNADLGTATHAHTFTDDDTAQVSFRSSGARFREFDATDTQFPIHIDLRNNVVSDRPITIPLSIDGASTASSSNDYQTNMPSTITIPAGQNGAEFDFRITADTRNESDETVIFDLGTPTNAQLVNPSTCTITIGDDD